MVFVSYVATTVPKANSENGEGKLSKVNSNDDHESAVPLPQEKCGQGEDFKVLSTVN